MRTLVNRRWANAQASRGLTLIELIIVITLLGVLTSAMAIGIMGQQKKANIGAARTFCTNLRTQSNAWMLDHHGECPTPEQLKAEKLLDTTANLKDPWGGAYKLSCDSDEIYCSSPGPDKKDGTDDDILVPAKQQ